MKKIALILILLWPGSAAAQVAEGRMWICTEISVPIPVNSDSAYQEGVLSCRPYDPLMDGADILVDYEFYFDYYEDLELDVKVEATNLSFEWLTLTAVVVCSDNQKETFELNFLDVEQGATETEGTYTGVCSSTKSVKSLSLEPKWVRDWRCSGCGTYTFDAEVLEKE